MTAQGSILDFQFVFLSVQQNLSCTAKRSYETTIVSTSEDRLIQRKSAESNENVSDVKEILLPISFNQSRSKWKKSADIKVINLADITHWTDTIYGILIATFNISLNQGCNWSISKVESSHILFSHSHYYNLIIRDPYYGTILVWDY